MKKKTKRKLSKKEKEHEKSMKYLHSVFLKKAKKDWEY